MNLIESIRTTEAGAVEVVIAAEPGFPRVMLSIAHATEVPDATSPRWSTVGTAAPSETVHVPGAAIQMPAWVRAAGSNADGARVTGWTVPEGVAFVPVPAVQDLRLVADDGGAVLGWTPGDRAETLDVNWAVHEEGEPPGALTAAEVPAGGELWDLPGRPARGQAVTAHVTVTDDGQVFTQLGEPVEDEAEQAVIAEGPFEGPESRLTTMRVLDLGTMTAPKHWLFTEGAIPVRDSRFRVVIDPGLELPADVVTNDGGDIVRTNSLNTVRAS
jgi:hypothetical protein